MTSTSTIEELDIATQYVTMITGAIDGHAEVHVKVTCL